MSHDTRTQSREQSRRYIERRRLQLIREASTGRKPDDGIHFRIRMERWLALGYYEEALNMHEAILASGAKP